MKSLKFFLLAFCFLCSSLLNSQTLYWVGGSGNFNDPLHWSYISGGNSGGLVPNESTDVVFDNNSGKGFISVQFNQFNACQSFSALNTQNKIIFSGKAENELNVYGSLLLSRLVDFDFTGQVNFDSKNTKENEINFYGKNLNADVFFKNGTYRIYSIEQVASKTLRFGAGTYILKSGIYSIGNFMSEEALGAFEINDSYLIIAEKIKIHPAKKIQNERVFIQADINSPTNYDIPLALTSSKTFTSVNSTNVVCPVTISLSPSCTGSCTGVLTVSLSTTCTNTPYKVLVSNAVCPAYTAALSNTNIPSVYTVTNACSCTGSNYNIFVFDGSNTFQSATSGNFVPNSAIIFPNNIPPCNLCNGVLQGSIIGSGPFTVTVLNSSTTIPTFTTTGSYSISSRCAGAYTFQIISAGGCQSNVVDYLTSPPPLTAQSGSICSGNSFNLYPTGASSFTISGGSAVVSPSVTSSYTIYGSFLGCTNSVVATVSVFPKPIISFSSTSLCVGDSYTINPSGAQSYTINGNNPVVSPTINTSYTVSGTSNNGCVTNTTVSLSVNSLPTITINNASLCLGSTFTLSPSGASSYTFSGGSAIVSPSVNSTYSITGTSSVGCTSTLAAVATVSVYSLPSVSASVSNSVICSGSTIILNGSGANTYVWSGGAINNTTFAPSSSSIFTVTGTNTLGCQSSATLAVLVNPSPTISLNNASICIGESFTLNPSGAQTYTFTNGGPVINPTTTSMYLVSGTSSNGCSSSKTTTITVNALPNITVNSGSICAGQSFSLNPNGAMTYTITGGNSVVSPTSSSSYTVFGTTSSGCTNNFATIANVSVQPLPSITVNSGTICSGQSFTLNPSGANTYTSSIGSMIVSPTITSTYSIIGTDTLGCASSIAAISTITVFANPTISVNSGSICAGDTFTISPNGAFTYTYSTGTSIVSPSLTTGYSVTGTSSMGCVSFSPAIGLISVSPLPAIFATSIQSLICSGEIATLTAIGAPTYSWSNGMVASNIQVLLTQSTTYTLIGSNSAGCTATAAVTQSVDACTGITSAVKALNDLLIYPNPTSGEFIIEATKDLEITIVNALGQFVEKRKIVIGKNKVDLSPYANGIYFIQFKSENKSESIKLIKE